MRNRISVRVAWALGVGGLVPFVVGAVSVWTLGPGGSGGLASDALCDYGACILSFLGGIRWGADVRRGEEPNGIVLALSVLPSLTAWLATLTAHFTGYRWTFVLLIAAFAVQGAWDMRSAALPDWMGRMRALLTLGAVGSLMAALIAA